MTPSLTPRDFIEPATRAANRAGQQWNERASDLLLWVLRNSERPLLVEVIASTAYAMGLSRPEEPRAWGGLIVTLQRAGAIAPAGVERDHRGSFKTTWRLA